MFLARVFISFKPSVNDPEGDTIRGALHDLGFGSVESVRTGKYMELFLRESDENRAVTRIEEICNRLLANPVIEQYRFELELVD